MAIGVLLRLAAMAFKIHKDFNPTHPCYDCGKIIPLDKASCDACFAKQVAEVIRHVKAQSVQRRMCHKCGKDCGNGGVMQENKQLLCRGCDIIIHGNDLPLC
jgi:hypothetical protein